MRWSIRHQVLLPIAGVVLLAVAATTFTLRRRKNWRVRGSEGPCWGTDVYTGDSSVACAAVHAGLVEPGASAVLRVLVVEPPERFVGSLRHGVASRDYARYDVAFRFEAMPTAGEA